MQFHKFISTILHPIVMPTIGVLLYLTFIPHNIQKPGQLALLGMVFIVTYLIPLITLVLLKALGLIKSFQVETIKERKRPLLLMMGLFYFLGTMAIEYSILRDFSILFYGTGISLMIIYILFITKLKSSLHLVAFGNAIAFFLWLSYNYSISLTPIIMILILFAGLLASSRLHLKAHQPKEVYAGFFIGFFSVFATAWLL